MFRLANECLVGGLNELRPLPRAVANELAMLGAVAPLVFTNITAGLLDRVFATDASNQKGAIITASVDPEVHMSIWVDADRKGSHTHFNNPFNAILRQIGENDDDIDGESPFPEPESIKKSPLMYFVFVEICGGAGKVGDALSRLGYSVAPVLDLSESAHYDLTSLRLMEWVIYMLEEGRFRSFLVAPPCTSFSPAGHPAVRSYALPSGFDRLPPETLLGNTLAFRALCLLRVGRRCRRPCGAEQSRLSKMCWLDLWTKGSRRRSLPRACFNLFTRKNSFWCFLLDTVAMEVRCCGGHSHVRVQGSLKASAVYTDALADHLALAYKRSLDILDVSERLSPCVDFLESVLSNEVMCASDWKVVRSWHWKREGHINVLKLGSTVSNMAEVAENFFSVRFANFVDSAVCRGALSKGRSASHALQPGLRRVCAVSVASDLYPAWTFSPLV